MSNYIKRELTEQEKESIRECFSEISPGESLPELFRELINFTSFILTGNELSFILEEDEKLKKDAFSIGGQYQEWLETDYAEEQYHLRNTY